MTDEIKDGPYETYWDNGRLREKGTWKDGELDGPYEEYHENGQLEYGGNYKDGLSEGLWKSYYENGQKYQECDIKDGKMHGKCIFYNSDGTIETTSYYKNGQKISSEKTESTIFTTSDSSNGGRHLVWLIPRVISKHS